MSISTCDASLLAFVQQQYALSASACFLPAESGMNNTTRLVQSEDQHYMLRVYETHRDADKAAIEHEVLIKLQQLQPPFSYATPCPTTNLAGSTISRTAEGKLAALYPYIAGSRPTLGQPEQVVSFGRAAASLGQALQRLDLPAERAVYPPYCDLAHAHPNCPPDTIMTFCDKPPAAFSDMQAQLQVLGQWCAAFYEQADELNKLPKQWIHGDLNASNMLADSNGEICALLDFEFVTLDLPLMEAAVCLSDLIVADDNGLIHTERSNARMDQFLQGWEETSPLNSHERNLLALLISLRRVDVFIHFLGRYFDGIDSITTVQRQIIHAARIITWLQQR